MPRTLFDLNFDGVTVFDGSSLGLRVRATGSLAGNGAGRELDMAASTRVRLARDKRIDRLDEFTLELTVRPDKLGKTQIVLDSQAPPIRLAIDRSGVLTASLHTANGWQHMKSRTKLSPGSESRIRLLRDSRGSLTLELGGRRHAAIRAAGELAPVGRAGISIGSDVKGRTGFAGAVSEVRLLEGAHTTGALRKLKTRERSLKAALEQLYDVPTRVVLDEGEVDPRFNQIKGIMHAAGVDDLSKLSTLTINRRTAIVPGTILKAASASSVGVQNWAEVATEFAGLANSDAAAAKRLADANLLARSVGRSVAIELEASAAASSPSSTASASRPVSPAVTTRASLSPSVARALSTSTGRATLASAVSSAGSTVMSPLSSAVSTRVLPDVVVDLRPAISTLEGVERLERDEPDDWPVMTAQPLMLTSNVLPVNSAVIIARRLDLTNQTLEIDPAVGTLYIIAEEIEAATGAAITWKRPPLATPNIGPDPSLDGHDWNGVHLAEGSKHGLPGGDARDGAPGIAGYHAHDAPNVEIWVLRINGMPDIDLEGQKGGKGGRGQRGGEGGRGARGRSGEWWWFFGKQCWDGPGNGGDGGDGGDGGRGGRGGNGGDGGDITFAVLEESLAPLTTTNAFAIDLGSGPAGDGGDGGPRGEGGPGGASGYTEVCAAARAGARGQPGRVGERGTSGTEGSDGQMTIMTVTQEAWDEQLTRPWLYDVSPDAAFPGTTVVLKGTRFADTDVVLVDGAPVPSTLRADGGLDVTLPTSLGGGEHSIYLRRHDGQESNRLPLVVKPQLTGTVPDVVPGTPIPLAGRAFLTGATVDYDGDPYPATVLSPTQLTFEVPDTATAVSTEQVVSLAVINPDGQRSNTLTGTVPQVLKNGFTIGVHDFSFDNDSDGRPSWGTFEDTYGAVEVWHELLDPVFGHPVLTTAFYFFYEHFLKGEDNGGLATGFCTSLASMALDRFWTGQHDTFASVVRDDAFRRQMTAIHGRLLTRESLLDFHDQGRRGHANVTTTFNEIESIFQSGGTRETAPMLFFVPAGAAWDAGYFDMLADSHCIVPVRITYPVGYDGSSLDGVRMYCWDNNHHGNHDCYVDFRTSGSDTFFTYFADGTEKFKSEDGITLAVSTLGEYLLRDLDLPFSGPLGLTTFVLDFLLSPATMQVIDGDGRVTGRVGGQILSEIPDSHPAYLIPNAYLLPKDKGLTRRITGTATGTYGYGSLSPDGVSMSLSNVSTTHGETDRVLANADGSRIRFVPGAAKSVDFTMGRRVGDFVRGLSVDGFQATPTADLDVTAAPDLSMVRVSNRGAATQVDVKLLGFDLPSESRASLERGAVNIPSDHDLVVAVSDWSDLVDANVATTVLEN